MYARTHTKTHKHTHTHTHTQLTLPNEFVEVVHACDESYMHILPRGWIPVPLEEATCFVGPQGQLCQTVDDVLTLSSEP